MNILFICTHNRCRSILSEAICRQLAGDKIQAWSAGSQPVGQVHPLSLKYLEAKAYNTEGLSSQSWNDFEQVKPEIVVTVCDSAANESCPVWFAEGIKVHWGLEDPSKLEGSEEEIAEAFFKVIALIEKRVQALLALDLNNRDKKQLEAELQAIGELK
ncbi:arsenate reductase ArsC [Agaribacterium haliotis]|uniref:arsenate reductase ArsC n=1 Tax=Agaribacterium haliotis TaxID=2013869 RepID=UPI000BB581F3|nr:arsenate reductase ArsC [Agaribacterium haliotis]